MWGSLLNLSTPPSLPLYKYSTKKSASASLKISVEEEASAAMGSWVRTITTPFRKACTLINPPRDEKKPQPGVSPYCDGLHERHRTELHGEVMACSYHDVQVMWSMLAESNSEERSRRWFQAYQAAAITCLFSSSFTFLVRSRGVEHSFWGSRESVNQSIPMEVICPWWDFKT